MNKKLATSLATALGLMVGAGSAQAVPLMADIATIVDESGSMSGEHAWLPGMISSLETGLLGAGVGTTTSNQYAKVGFGGHVAGQVPHKHQEGGLDWFGAGTYTNDFSTNGSFEDGWNGLDFFFDNYTTRANAALNLILVTDEDRDNQNGALSKAGLTSRINSVGALLNAVVDADFRCGDGSSALGVDSAGTGYVADGAGGFSTCSGASAVSGFGTTVSDYVDLALATGGAAWDLGFLRAGGNTAASFTNAFVDIKVQEIRQQPPTGVPAPAPFALLGLGLLSLAGSRRLRR